MEKPGEPSSKDALMRSEGVRIVKAANERNIHLRLLGAIAFQTHCPKYNYLTSRLRRVLSDVDFAAYGSERNQIEKMMREFGYADQPMVTALFGSQRMIWDNKANGMHVDIFFDKLEMNHNITFQGRLGIDEATISLADMLLEKMQIVRINEKDIVDTIMLLREHKIGGNSPETIDAEYIAKLLSNDWGFYYTFTTNLKKVQDALTRYPELTKEDQSDITGKIQDLSARMEKVPKTFGWKVRAKMGPKTKWYKDVEDVTR